MCADEELEVPHTEEIFFYGKGIEIVKAMGERVSECMNTERTCHPLLHFSKPIPNTKQLRLGIKVLILKNFCYLCTKNKMAFSKLFCTVPLQF